MTQRIHVAAGDGTKPANDEEKASSMREFTERTTMHGCQSLMQRDYHAIRRLMWVTLMLLSTGLFLNALIVGVRRYFSFPSSVSVDIQPNTNLSLPDITVCNNNYFSAAYLQRQNDSVKKLVEGIFGQPDQLSDPLVLTVTDQMGYADFFFNSMAPLDTFISNCRLYMTAFDCADLISRTLSFNGACYRLNLSNVTFEDPNPMYGFKFEISLNESDYSPYSRSTGMGVKLIFNEHGEYADERWEVAIQPNTDVHVALQKTQNIRLGKPYSREDCHEGEVEHSLYSVYTARGCVLNCMNEYYRLQVQCGLVRSYPGLRNCTLSDSLEIANDVLNAMTEDCHCPRPCQETIYSASFSSMTYHGPPTQPNIKKISVNVFYPTFDVSVVSQEAAYTFNSFIADVGGQMGFFLGASILTWSEMFEFVIVSLLKKLQGN